LPQQFAVFGDHSQVIDADGVIRWSYVSPVGVNPGADGILRALEELDGREEST
jgi:alkyl hydroperoxide reductase subunit AhpC